MRREGRRAALQLLYAVDAGQAWDRLAEQQRLFFANLAGELSAEERRFAESLCQRVQEELEPLDRLIEAASRNWRLERMSRVDRNILRVAAAELCTRSAPAPVVLDEAIELAKEFGGAESPAFVNGVLNRLAADLGAAPR